MAFGCPPEEPGLTSEEIYAAVDRVVRTYVEIKESMDPDIMPAAFGVAVGLLRAQLDITLHTAALLIKGALEVRGID